MAASVMKTCSSTPNLPSVSAVDRALLEKLESGGGNSDGEPIDLNGSMRFKKLQAEAERDKNKVRLPRYTHDSNLFLVPPITQS